MLEQSKSAKRRYYDGAFHSRYFVGSGIDIGGGSDSLGGYCGVFRAMKSVKAWDLVDGDAQSMMGVPDQSYDFVHSSHCLEHVRDVREALRNWTRIVRTGGFLIVTVPDEDLYELGSWPSRFNSDHKWSFTTCKSSSTMPKSINVIDLVKEFSDHLSLERLQLHRDFFRDSMAAQGADQTCTPVAECSIEIIWRRT